MSKLAANPTVPATVAFTSGRKHRAQYLFKIPIDQAKGVRSRKLKTGKGEALELRGQNLTSILPPSIHPTTGSYHWLPGLSPTQIEVAPAPDWLIAQMSDTTAVNEVDPVVDWCAESIGHSRLISSLNDCTLKIAQVDDAKITKALLLLEVIHPKFSDDYDTWIKTGMALKSVSPNLLAAWDAWSQMSHKYKEGECAYKWDSFNPQRITIKYLFRLALLS